VRLLILCHVLTHGGTTFTELRAALGLTDGTLSVHLGKLAAGRVIRMEKRFVNKRPQTMIKITATGRRQFQQYVQELRSLVPGLEG
jgi:DNA-binding MarR family transcriptional regulator